MKLKVDEVRFDKYLTNFIRECCLGHFCSTNIELSILISSVAIKNISIGKMTKTPLLFLGLILKLTIIVISNYRFLYFKIIVKTTTFFFLYQLNNNTALSL